MSHRKSVRTAVLEAYLPLLGPPPLGGGPLAVPGPFPSSGGRTLLPFTISDLVVPVSSELPQPVTPTIQPATATIPAKRINFFILYFVFPGHPRVAQEQFATTSLEPSKDSRWRRLCCEWPRSGRREVRRTFLPAYISEPWCAHQRTRRPRGLAGSC